MSSPYLSHEAFRMAITEAKNGQNVELYLQFANAFGKLALEDPLAKIDETWVDMKTKRVKAETDRLEHELKTYKNNLIKESIRVNLN
jgi:COP9 signalosome complex subunit 1